MRKPSSSIQNREPGEPISEEWKRYIVWWSEQKGNSLRVAAKHFHVPVSCICNWKKVIKGGKPLQRPGRPHCCDEEALDHLQNEVEKKYLENATTPAGKYGIDGESTIHDMILEGVKATSERNGKFFNGAKLDPKTEKKCLERSGLAIRAAELTTGYRARACTSIYMAASTCVLFNCFTNLGVVPALLINLDCTRSDIILNSVPSSMNGVVPRALAATNKKSSAKFSTKVSKKDFIGIRWFPCINALGDMGPTILIVADDNMEKEKISVREVLTLVNYSNNVCNYDRGYIVFLKNTPGKEFFEWYVSQIVTDFIRRLKLHYSLKDDDTAFVFHDGEYCQVNTWDTNSNGITENYKELHVAVGKLGASTTGISQPLDAYKVFSAVHDLVLKSFKTDTIQKENFALHLDIDRLVENQINTTKSAKLRKNKRVVVHGLQWMHRAIKHYGTREMGTKSFKEVGIEVHNAAIICNPGAVIEKYKQTGHLTGDKHHKVMTFGSQCMALTDKFIALGSLPDKKLWESIDLVKELDEFTDVSDLERDKRALSQQRCVLLTTPTLTAKQARLKKNEEERKKKAKEEEEKKKQVQIDIGRGQLAFEERKKKELADLKAKNVRDQAEIEGLRKQIALYEAKERQKDARNTPKKAQKRKKTPSNSSFASNGGQEGFSDGMLRTLTTTFENKVVENMGRDRGEGKRLVKRKLY